MVYAPDRATSVLHVAKKIGVERVAIIAYPSSNSLQIVAGAQELGQEAGPRGRADGEMGTRIRSSYHSKTLGSPRRMKFVEGTPRSGPFSHSAQLLVVAPTSLLDFRPTLTGVMFFSLP